MSHALHSGLNFLSIELTVSVGISPIESGFHLIHHFLWDTHLDSKVMSFLLGDSSSIGKLLGHPSFNFIDTFWSFWLLALVFDMGFQFKKVSGLDFVLHFEKSSAFWSFFTFSTFA